MIQAPKLKALIRKVRAAVKPVTIRDVRGTAQCGMEFANGFETEGSNMNDETETPEHVLHVLHGRLTKIADKAAADKAAASQDYDTFRRDLERIEKERQEKKTQLETVGAEYRAISKQHKETQTRLSKAARAKADADKRLEVSALNELTKRFSKPKKNCMSCGAEFAPKVKWDKAANAWEDHTHLRLCPKCRDKATNASPTAHQASGDTGGKVD